LDAIAWDADTSYSSTYSGDKAYDGLLSTKWTSTDATADHWLALDLGQEHIITGYTLQLAGAGGEWTMFNWQHYAVQTGPSLSGPWTTAFTVDNTVQLNSPTSVYDVPVRARYVRTYVNDCGIDNYARLPEFEVIGDPPPRADFDTDGDVDLADFPVMQLCFSGPGVAHPGAVGSIDCSGADLEHGDDDPDDGDVDLLDVAAFVQCLVGPNGDVPLECY
jgi:hypothetical protein